MDGIRQWAFSLCAAMVALGISQMVLPKGSSGGMEKIFKTTVSVFFLCCLLSPIVLGDADLQVEWREYSQEEIDARAERLLRAAEAQAEGLAGAELAKIIEEKLAQRGINHHGITIHMITDGQRQWEEAVPTATILLDMAHEPDKEKIRLELEEEFGIAIQVSVSSGGAAVAGQEGG